MKANNLVIPGVICAGMLLALTRHAVIAGAPVSFKIHNNQSNIKVLTIYDAADKNNPNPIKTIKNVKAGSTTDAITMSTIPGANVGRASWSWDDNQTNFINVSNGGVYELSSGAETR